MFDAPDANVRAQSERAKRGRIHEDVVAYLLNNCLPQGDIFVTRGQEAELRRLIRNDDNVRSIMSYLRLPVKRRCTQNQLEDYPDSDLLVVIRPSVPTKPWRVMAIINCKVSLRERYIETCFWGAAIRASSYLKYLFVTEDPDGELGASCESSRKARRLLECFTDRVYLIKRYSGTDSAEIRTDVERKQAPGVRHAEEIVFGNPPDRKDKKYCHLVRPFDDLIQDLLRWKDEVPN